MEYLDLYDHERRPLGRTLARGEPFAEGEYHIVTAVWTVNSRGRILLTLRAPSKRYYPGLWENTGGAVQSGETSRSAAIRELFEETGIRAEQDELIFIKTTKEANYFADTYLLCKDPPPSGIVLQPSETVDAKWVALDELDAMIAVGQIVPPAASQLAPVRDKLEALVFSCTH
ncbi:MAG: NUDIX hydrolase [Clostridiales bacterium]|nr:MAG: NUDIX hydrolase [Clostridiales bacterium]